MYRINVLQACDRFRTQNLTKNNERVKLKSILYFFLHFKVQRKRYVNCDKWYFFE